MTDEILTVTAFSKDQLDPAGLVICPHCDKYAALEWPCRGEQYKHRCGGWLHVDLDAKYVRADRNNDADDIERRLREVIAAQKEATGAPAG